MVSLRKKKLIELHPAYLLILGFGMIIMMGALIFMLPMSTMPGHRLGFIDALFEATSAVCVTGLVVVDTGTTFSLFGQMVLLSLIQIGGWGFVTVSVFMATMLGKKLSLKEKLFLQSSLNSFSLHGLIPLVSRIIYISLIIELVGVMILTIRWSLDMPWDTALYYAIFHSISAFNNAGFGLEADSMTKWVGDPIINISLTLLLTAGGIGFTVLVELWERRSLRKLSLHAKMTISVSLILNILAVLLIFLSEFHNPQTIGPLSLPDKFWASYFQGIVPRTAGFNSIEIGQMTYSSQMLIMALMFIGAGTTSTAGGIKVTTFALIGLAIWTEITDKDDVHVFKRRIPWELVNKAFYIGLTAIMFIFLVCFLLTFTEQANMRLIVFETISAFGTVGLSAGLTDDLSPAGRILISILMFIGRVGPLTMAFALIKHKDRAKIKYAEEKILIG